MDALSKMRDFIKSFPKANVLDDFFIDYTDKVPNSGGLFPSGLVEIRRRKFIDGSAEVDNQYNFALYTVMLKSPNDDAGATDNASWQMEFQEWVQSQSVTGKAPTFGDDPRSESIVAQNGQLYSAEDEGFAMYVIRISVSFKKRF